MKKYLVTGRAGFIGSHIVRALVGKGNFVRVLDNFSSGKRENLSGITNRIHLIKGDIRSPETCLKATRGMDFVLHQAALRSVPKSLKEPREFNAVNIGGTLNLLAAARKEKVKVFIFASSSSVYGDARRFPEKEEFLPRPVSPYALTKIAGEYYCRIFSENYGLATVILRYFNVFGPRQALDDEYAVVIPKFISCLLKGRRPPIYGTGKQSRDFTYVDNVVQANIKAAELRNSRGEVFNVGCGREHSILFLLSALNKIMHKNTRPVFLAKRAGDVFRTQASLARSKKILHFRPEVNFVEGLKLTVDYFKHA
ncbi:MAG: SDR family oxidoreductase [Candidatus Omnitrophica bacterium]|nr:SDR family oxidoreductase [Candidatus Omnitrophota bacterium]